MFEQIVVMLKSAFIHQEFYFVQVSQVYSLTFPDLLFDNFFVNSGGSEGGASK
jgi:hypothetical protein